MNTELVKIPGYIRAQTVIKGSTVSASIFPNDFLKYMGSFLIDVTDMPSCPPVGSKVTITITYEEET